MYDLRQFRTMLYTVLTLSVVGYGIALESPAHVLIGVVLVQLNRWATAGGREFALPKFLCGAIALATGAWCALGLSSGAMTPLLAVSQWLFFLMLVLLWGRHDNRAYAQMLLMSLVIMVAGAINSASLFYGLALIGYVFLSLYCCLLFHLKVENEHAAKVYQVPREQLEIGTARTDRALFNRSMRRLTELVSVVSLVLAMLVFLFFPRASTPTLMMQLQAAQRAPMTGFSERVSFDQVARITQSNDIVAHVALTKDGQPYRPPELYLRGTTLDIYTGGTTRREGLRWQWLRSMAAWESGRMQRFEAGRGSPVTRSSEGGIQQDILLKPTGSATLFALDGANWLMADRQLDVQYFANDGTLRLTEVPRSQLQYSVISSGQPPQPVEPSLYMNLRPPGFNMMGGFLPTESVIDPAITEYARRPDVSGIDQDQALYEKRGGQQGPTDLDATIAKNIESHLQTQFRYTLDLTDTRRGRSQDPIAAFLTDFKRGHCEYFAGAMTLMCQSLGLDARMVIGFRIGAEDYNQIGGYFVVRQSHAHAWVEVLTPEGWRQYDPTAGQYYVARGHPGFFRRIGDFFDYLQYRWATSVVTYSNESRIGVWHKLEAGVAQSLAGGTGLMTHVREFLRSDQAYRLSSRLILFAIAASVLGMIVAILAFVLEKRRLYRRAERIGLSSLPAYQQLRLARQLAFYDELLQLLARRRLYRRPDMTHREFIRSLSFLPAETYSSVCDLTDVFYRVRYGGRSLEPAQRRRLSLVIARLSETLSGKDTITSK